ncbi:MAG TPA: hypothetical protein VFQ54_07850 [Thermomicrobiales bacterium]|nr:hypothetical protein [Thermomicrobiales bacterium]
MFIRRLFAPIAFSLPMLSPEDSPAGETKVTEPVTETVAKVDPPKVEEPTKVADPAKVDKPDKVEFNEAQQQKFNDAIAAVRKTTEETVRAAIAAEAAAAKQKADEDTAREEAEKRGEFDKVKTDLEGKLATAEDALKTTTDELTNLRELFTEHVKTQTKEWSKELKDLLASADAPVKDQVAQMTKVQKLADEMKKTTGRGNGPDPDPAGKGKVDVTSPISKANMW